jgi:protein-L-isoaspartate(D-aspartate) O-methyltransferase
MHAYALEWLKDNLVPGARILDVGCGSGILLAYFHEICEQSCQVTGIEHIPGLAEFSKENLQKNYG